MRYLLVIDCQNDFIDGALGTDEARARVSNIAKFIRDFDGKVMATRDTHTENYLKTFEGKRLPIPHCIVDSSIIRNTGVISDGASNGWKINDEIAESLKTKRGVELFTKSSFGAFSYIRHMDRSEIDEIVLVGFCTDICVISNALILRTTFQNVPITVVENCCAGTTPEKHKAALEVMKSCQIDVI